jgi:hypothetical protein
MVIHDIIPTNVKLHRIRLTDTDVCTQCAWQDTLLHRLTECGETQEIWEWTLLRIALIQSIDPRHIPKKWLICLSFKLWPRPKHPATLWFLTNMVFYVISRHRTLSVTDYINFMRRTQWKTNKGSKRMQYFGNYLEVF